LLLRIRVAHIGVVLSVWRRKQMSEDSISWEELAELTHATQVERFGWCICEDTDGEGQLADDCPREGADA
jgi:hypothetical protein